RLTSVRSAAAALGTAALLTLQQPVTCSRAIAGDLDMRTDCGARGDGRTDDSGAVKRCLARLDQLLSSGHPTVLHFPAGIYRLTGANGLMPVIRGHAGTIEGEGPHATFIVLDASFRGDLFAWSEAWMGSNGTSSAYDVFKDDSGPTVIGIHISGAASTTNDQN